MKKVMFFLLLLPFFAHSQWLYNGNHIYYNNGYVGVGTTNPQSLLDIRSDNNDAGLRISTSDNAIVGAFTWRTGAVALSAGGYQSPDMIFNTGGSERLRISSNGNVGIGMANPGFKLSVVGDGYFNGHLYSETNSNEGGAISLINNTKTGANASRWTIYNMTGSSYGNALKFWRYSADLTNTGPQLVLDDNGASAFTGALGVGTTAPPAADLHVGQKLSNVFPEKDISVARIAIQPYFHTGGPWFIDSRDNNSTAYLDIRYGTQKLFAMDHNGNIGIGVQSPSDRLTVNGNIRTRKVIVTQTGWPDYVFDSSYQLPSLDSVSSFIQVNKRLPDMPSAAVVEKDGHDLGEVQKQLLKKVEELTLYVIELKKENEAQQKEINLLKRNK